ncbi:MAG: hypothetical protein IKZ23_02295 [Clostridia bacterium]|nr:hypothetical protein [Clostridia bacterium]
MKKLLLLVLALLCIIPVAGCQAKPKSRTAEFYHGINYDSYYYKATVTKNNSTYTYTQAIKDGTETTIEDHQYDEYDKYVITQGDLMHILDNDNKRYNTLQSNNITHFMFSDNDYTDFNYPESDTLVYVSDKPYNCESFNTVDSKGNVVGSIKYYFELEGDLAAIEWYTGENITALLVMIEHSETIPTTVYTAIPEGYKAGTFSTEQEFDPWEDLE